jgi:hypothetical protein
MLSQKNRAIQDTSAFLNGAETTCCAAEEQGGGENWGMSGVQVDLWLVVYTPESVDKASHFRFSTRQFL